MFPFSRMSYRPSNEQQFFSRLEEVVEMKALSSPLATVNILMSLFQLGHFPGPVLHRVFSSAFINNVTSRASALSPAQPVTLPVPVCDRRVPPSTLLPPQTAPTPSSCGGTCLCWTPPWSWSTVTTPGHACRTPTRS